MEVLDEDDVKGTALAVKPQSSNALANSDANRAIAEIQAMVIVAQKCPRDPIRARDNIMAAFTRPKLAKAALYQYARGGTNIVGPSIRAAEAIAQNWGNMRFGVRELDQRYGESTVEAFAWDLQSNTIESRSFQMPHKIGTKKGPKTLEDPRDIYELVANNGARRMRACILAIIPADLIEEAVEQINKTLTASVNITPELVASLIEKFAAVGVSKSALEANIQRRLDEKTLTPALVIRLGSIYNSINDGMSNASDYFDVAPTESNGTTRTEEAITLLSRKIETPFEDNKKGKDEPDFSQMKGEQITTILEGEAQERGMDEGVYREFVRATLNGRNLTKNTALEVFRAIRAWEKPHPPTEQEALYLGNPE